MKLSLEYISHDTQSGGRIHCSTSGARGEDIGIILETLGSVGSQKAPKCANTEGGTSRRLPKGYAQNFGGVVVRRSVE